MSPTEQISSILKEKYVTPEGAKFKIMLNVGLSESQVASLAKRLGVPGFPHDIHKLLKMTSGFDFYGLKEIRFDNANYYGYEDLFPRAIILSEDDFGNFWAVDVKSDGAWGAVFYVSLDPAVIIKHSESITDFIKDVHEFGKLWDKSKLERIHRQRVLEIWSGRTGLVDSESLTISRDPVLRSFARSLPENCIIADLRKKAVESGFIWRGYGSRSRIIRLDDEYLWAIHRPARKTLISLFTPALSKTREIGRSILAMKLIKDPAH